MITDDNLLTLHMWSQRFSVKFSPSPIHLQSCLLLALCRIDQSNKMSLPGMAPQAGAGGVSDQEQKYVKMVCEVPIRAEVGQVLTLLADAIGHGIMSGQVHHGRRDGFRTRWRIWIIHVQCMFLDSYSPYKRRHISPSPPFSSSCLALNYTPRLTTLLDVLRHTAHPSRPSDRQSPRSRTTPPRLQRHGLAVLFISQKFCYGRRHLLRDRMLHRRVPREVRLDEQCHGGLHNRRDTG